MSRSAKPDSNAFDTVVRRSCRAVRSARSLGALDDRFTAAAAAATAADRDIEAEELRLAYAASRRDKQRALRLEGLAIWAVAAAAIGGGWAWSTRRR